MKKQFSNGILLAASIMTTSTFASELCINMTNLLPAQGYTRIAIVDTEAGFKGEAHNIAGFFLPVHHETMSVCVSPLKHGNYAVRVIQDVDGDGEMATNLLGMPQEPWGTSNNAKGRFGPPKWEDARFELGAEKVTQNINLNQ